MANLLQTIQFKLYQMAMKAQGSAGVAIPYNMSTKPEWTSWDAKTAVNEGYKAAVFVYSCIQKRSRAVASVPWYVYQQGTGGEWEKVENHPLQLLIERPNPFMSRSDLLERMVINLDLAGNSLYKKVLVNNTPVELWPIGPDGIKPVPDATEFIKEYEFKQDNKKIGIPPDEVLHAMYIDPGNVYWGLAPLQVAAKTVDTDVQAVTWNKVALQNRAVTDGVFSFDQALTRDQWLDARNMVREQHQGSANARAPWVLGSGAKWNSMALSPADMDFINGRKMTREEICTVFDVPPPIVGILDKANYSNMREARRVFWLDTIIPLLENIKNIFNRALTPAFGEGIELDFDLSNVEALQDNFNEKINGAYKLWTMGLPFNTINQRLELGFDEIPGGETGFLPASIMPATLAAGTTANPPQQNQPLEPPAPELIPPGETNPPQDQPKRQPGPINQKNQTWSKRLNLRTSEQKAEFWKAFERSRFQWYKKFQKDAAEQFKTERDAVVAAYKQHGNINKALAAIDPKPWEALYKHNYMAIATQYGSETVNTFKSFAAYEKKADEPQPQPLADFDPWDTNIQMYLESMAAAQVTNVTDFTKEQIKGIITDMRETGASIEDIAINIDAEFVSMSEYRAFRIARTEVVSASNFGSYFGALQASDSIGREMEKEWIDSGDDRVRERHEKMNGETVNISEKFSNNMDYPGDSMNGTAKDVVQCRCTMAYHII